MTETNIFPDSRMDSKAAAAYLGISHKTIQNWRHLGTSPKFIKIGSRIFYRQSDLDQFIEENSGYTSTSQAKLKGGNNG